MKARDRLYLEHIETAIEDIEAFTAEGKTSFMADRKTQSVIRQFEIIGEAVKNLSDAVTARDANVPWRAIARTRDRLIHAYFSVSLEAVWSMIEDDLPSLAASVRSLLAAAR